MYAEIFFKGMICMTAKPDAERLLSPGWIKVCSRCCRFGIRRTNSGLMHNLYYVVTMNLSSLFPVACYSFSVSGFSLAQYAIEAMKDMKHTSQSLTAI
jgi:hypothetical protein